jgi:MYXO-CTERM domain-containing protein
MARGLTAVNGQDELPGILDAMEKDEVDSDGDGVGDIDELRDGADPNIAGSTLSPPTYGCLSTTPRTAPAALLALLALGLVRRRR